LQRQTQGILQRPQAKEMLIALGEQTSVWRYLGAKQKRYPQRSRRLCGEISISAKTLVEGGA
jgi:hypothetical protein